MSSDNHFFLFLPLINYTSHINRKTENRNSNNKCEKLNFGKFCRTIVENIYLENTFSWEIAVTTTKEISHLIQKQNDMLSSVSQ